MNKIKEDDMKKNRYIINDVLCTVNLPLLSIKILKNNEKYIFHSMYKYSIKI